MGFLLIHMFSKLSHCVYIEWLFDTLLYSYNIFVGRLAANPFRINILVTYLTLMTVSTHTKCRWVETSPGLGYTHTHLHAHKLCYCLLTHTQHYYYSLSYFSFYVTDNILTWFSFCFVVHRRDFHPGQFALLN